MTNREVDKTVIESYMKMYFSNIEKGKPTELINQRLGTLLIRFKKSKKKKPK